MQNNILKKPITLIIGLLLSTSLAYAKPVLNIQHWQTPNKVSVYFVRTTQLPMLDIRLIFPAGSACDGALYGVANLTNSMLNQGTKTLNADQIAERFDNTGAQLVLGVGRDSSVVGLRSLTKDSLLNSGLNLLHQLITTPSFPSKNLQIQKQQTLTSIAATEQSPPAVAYKTLMQTLYKNHPYGHPIIGVSSTVNKINRENLLHFYKNHYLANNAILVLVGNITKNRAMKIANRLTTGIATGTKSTSIKQPKQITKKIVKTINFPSNQTAIRIGTLGIAANDPDYFPLIVGNHALGGNVLVSKLFMQVREKRGLSYGISSYFAPLKVRGPFIISLQTRTVTQKKAANVATKTLQDFIKNGPSKKELQAAKKNMIGRFALSLDSNTKITSIISKIALYHLSRNYLDTYRQKVKNVTIAQVKTAFQKLFNPQKLITIKVGKQ